MISPKFCNAYESFRQINFTVAICWAAGKGLGLLLVDLVLTQVKKEQAKRASLRFTEKKMQGLLESLRRVFKKLNVQQSEHFLEFLQNLLF